MGMLVTGLFWLKWIILLAGARLAWRYYEGRVAGDHPTCGRCGYDLRGRDPASPRCPECGTYLDGRDAVAKGRRVRRVGPAVAVVVATLVAFSGAQVGQGKARAHELEVRTRPQRLMAATTSGNAAAVAALLKLDPRLAQGEALHWAATVDQPAVVQLLIDHGAPVGGPPGAGNEPPLVVAARRASPPVVQALLKAGANVRAVDQEGRTALHHAARDDASGQAVPLLIAAGADPNAVDSVGRTPLHDAADASSAGPSVDLLVKAGAEVDARDQRGITPLHVAMVRRNTKGVQALLAHGADLAAKDAEGKSPTRVSSLVDERDSWVRDMWRSILEPEVKAGRMDRVRALLKQEPQAARVSASYGTLLHWAVESDNLELVNVLLDAGADPNAPSESSGPPLHTAMFHGKPEMVRLLVKRGAEVNGRDAERRTALHRVARFSRVLENTRLLLELGADPAAEDRDGNPPVTYLATDGFPHDEDVLAAIRLLFDEGSQTTAHAYAALGSAEDLRVFLKANPSAFDNARDPSGRSPLHVAARWGRVEAIRLLLDLGADVNRRDRAHVNPGGNTPLLLAADGGHGEAVKLLLERGADAKVAGEHGMTALHHTAIANEASTRLLIARGADVNARNRVGQTPLHVAVANGNVGVIEALLAAGADVSVPDGSGRTPLQSVSKHHEVRVRPLLEAAAGGAKPGTPGPSVR